MAIRLFKKAAKLDAASKFKSMQANARIIKYYRSKIMKSVTESIKHNFADAFQQHAQDPQGLLADLDDWIYSDIYRVETDIVPCFPPDYDMYALFAKEYHKAVNGTIKRVLDAEPEASVLLMIHQWIKDYKKKMKDLEVPTEYLEPPLLEGNEQGLIDDYLKLIVKKLDEWTTNLMKTEIRDFTARSEPPEIDSDGMYGMQGAVILFQMVNQQVDVATESGQGAILAQVVSEVNRIIRGTQNQWTKTLEAEYKTQTEKPEEAVGGLDSYSIALANDQIKSADNVETLLARLEALVSEKYRVPINEKLNDAIDGYLDVAKKCIQVLIGVIFNDLKPAMKQLFTAPWYDGVMVQIVETIRDYMSDCQEFLNPALLDHLADDLIQTFIVAYLTALAHSSKLKMPAATDRIKEDIGLVFEFFSTVKPAKDIEVDFEVIEMVLGLLEASKSMVFLSFWSFAKIHGPNIPFVEGIVKARGDLDRSAVNEVMESVKRKVKEDNLTDRELFLCQSCLLLTPYISSHSATAYYHEESHHARRTLALPSEIVPCGFKSLPIVLYTLHLSYHTRTDLYLYPYPTYIYTFAFLYSVLVLSAARFLCERSGSTAAISSIFLNCQGKREGYRNGRKSNPKQLLDGAHRHILYKTHCYHPDCTIPMVTIVSARPI